MYFGSKGWYVNELNKLGIRTYEGEKLGSYRTHVLSSLLERMKKTSA
ncbi:YflJ family protein [Bacillus sp. S1-R1J2-FB]|nr:YflJ family protein [Bacillus sp. S1-R1J2-FB]